MLFTIYDRIGRHFGNKGFGSHVVREWRVSALAAILVDGSSSFVRFPLQQESSAANTTNKGLRFCQP